MDDRAFDNLARTLGGARSRRQVLRRLGTSLVSALAGAVSVQRAARAQEFCPGAVLPNITECCTVDTVAEDCTPRECRTAICDAACACCTYIEVDDREPCDGGICCNTGGSGSVCFTGGECCAAGDCEPVACQTVNCDQDDRICFSNNEPDGTACSGGCCETGFCDTSKKPCGEQCINQNACCTNNQPGCPAVACQTATCSNGTCQYQDDPNGDSCAGGICCGGTCIAGGECCSAAQCAPQACQTATCNNNNSCDIADEADGSPCANGGICCGGDCKSGGQCCAVGECTPQTCQTARCSNDGSCEYQDEADDSPCAGGSCCGGQCRDLQTNANHCGTCGTTCAANQTCCSGTCRNLRTDESNCGQCGKQCTDTQLCAVCKGDCGGKAIAKCCPTTRRTNCSGACVNTNTDEANCGNCGRQCKGRKVCKQGECV